MDIPPPLEPEMRSSPAQTNELNELEKAVLEKFLAGDHPALALLRTQAARVRVLGRNYTGVGFFCDLDVSEGVPTLSRDFVINDVHGELSGLEHGAGFALFIRGGRLHTIEGFAYDEDWPKELGPFELKYWTEPRQLALL